MTLFVRPVEIVDNRKQYISRLPFDPKPVNNATLYHSHGRTTLTVVGGITVPPGTPGLPAPITVAPFSAISGNAAVWAGVKGAVADALHSTHPISPAPSTVTQLRRVRTPLGVWTVISGTATSYVACNSFPTAADQASPAAL